MNTQSILDRYVLEMAKKDAEISRLLRINAQLCSYSIELKKELEEKSQRS